MKKFDTSHIQEGVRRLGARKGTFDHLQEAYTEVLSDILSAMLNNVVTVLCGCVNSGAGSNYNISAGAIYYSGQVYRVDAFTGVAPGGTVPVLSTAITYRTGDPVSYTDGSFFNTHAIEKIVISFGPSGSGIADYSSLTTFKSQLNTVLGVAAQITSALTPISASIATKVSKAGDSMTGALAMGANKITGLADPSANSDAVTFQSMGGLKKTIVNIGDWNMSVTIGGGVNTISVNHGLTLNKIRSITGVIRSDDDLHYFPIGIFIPGLANTDGVQVTTVSTTQITLSSKTGGGFDNANFDATGFNRGYLVIEYLP